MVTTGKYIHTRNKQNTITKLSTYKRRSIMWGLVTRCTDIKVVRTNLNCQNSFRTTFLFINSFSIRFTLVPLITGTGAATRRSILQVFSDTLLKFQPTVFFQTVFSVSEELQFNIFLQVEYLDFWLQRCRSFKTTSAGKHLTFLHRFSKTASRICLLADSFGSAAEDLLESASKQAGVQLPFCL